MAVQFGFQVQQPDGSVVTQQSLADRAPTWGELADHVASTGGTLLPSTPAEQPAPVSTGGGGAAAPPAPLPTDVQQTTGMAPTDVNPPRALWTQVLPTVGTALGTAGATMLLGPEASYPTYAGLTALGAGLGAAGGEAGQVGVERAFLGPGPPGAPSAAERIGKAGVEAAGTQVILGPAARWAVGQIPVAGPVMRAAGAARDLLTAPAEDALVGGRAVAASAAQDLNASLNQASSATGAAAPTLWIDPTGVQSLVNPARAAVARAGATPDQLALFDQTAAPLMSGQRISLPHALAVERHLGTWVDRMAGSGVPDDVLAPVRGLAGGTQGLVTQSTVGTAAEPLRASYVAQLQAMGPARAALNTAANPATDAAGFARALAADNHAGLSAALERSGAAERAQLAQGWLASTRAGAQGAVDPLAHVAEQYTALPTDLQRGLFGAGSADATGQLPIPTLLRAAQTATPSGTRIPMTATGLASRAIMWPATGAARYSLLSPDAGWVGSLPQTIGAAAPPLAFPYVASAMQARPGQRD
jgi:hypothetical protein